ncbi:Alpha/Beta hydrolase protein [Tribonema minus]|uniref:Alpha/Beta hydrolase protein n=1 Tax=Tribonema minus TaxID=303371 RepID=A0A836CJP5_9STRA|nr:Alpha/Beta hydrolase protein [Tribonema minus]
MSCTLSLTCWCGPVLPPLAPSQTAVLAFQAPVPLPFDMGYCWHDTFDDEGDTLAYTPGDERRMKSLNASTSTLIQAIEALRLQLHWPTDCIFLFGYAQGGTVALSTALTLAHASAPPIPALGGVISICGVLLEEQLAVAAGAGAAPARPAAEATPVLILCGDKDAQAPPHLAHASAAALHSSGSSAGSGSDSRGSSTAGGGSSAEVVVLRGRGAGPLRSEREVRPVMAFLARCLSRRMVALEDSADVVELSGSGLGVS